MKRNLSVALGAIASLMLVVGAFAFWTNSTGGTANGGAQAAPGDTAVVTVANVTGGTGLVPGGASNNVTADLSTSDASTVQATSATVTITGTSDNTNCPASEFASTSVGGAFNGTVIDGTPNNHVVGTVRLTETGVNQDDCKNVTVNLTVAVDTD